MSWIAPITMNMDLSRNLSEGKWDHPLLQTIQKIAIYSIIPFALVVLFEALIKNLIFINLANLGIALLNRAYDCFRN